MCAVSDQESEPAAAAEDVPIKLEQQLKRFMSQATQTAGDVTGVANDGISDMEKTEDKHEQVQITGSLSEVSVNY